LYTTEMQGQLPSPYHADREVGCTVCGIPALTFSSGTFHVDASSETSVYTRWGATECEATNSRLIYTGFIAGEKKSHTGGGANSLCMTLDGAVAPSGYSDESQNGNLLYHSEYRNNQVLDKNANGDAACAVCEYTSKLRDVYIQWGRSKSCDNSHADVYKGLVMGSWWSGENQKSMHICVDYEREGHGQSQASQEAGNSLYTTEMEDGSANENAYTNNVEVGCAACAANKNRTVFTRWGSNGCPAASSTLVYTGFMASSSYNHVGGGANTLCMHPNGQSPDGSSTGNENGNLLYGMEYENTGAIDKNKNKDAACAVCELDRWEAVYTQWGRSNTCTNGHQTLYSGLVMANKYTQRKGEFICVDVERAAHSASSDNDDNGGLLYTTEMQAGSADEVQYPTDVEVGCSVCAAQSLRNELPFAAQVGNAIRGQWVKIRTMHIGHDVTVSYGYEAASGTSSTEEETKESSYTRVRDVSVCFSSSIEASLPTTSWTVGVEACASYGDEKMESIASTTAKETSWDASQSQMMEDTFYVPEDRLPPGTPEAAMIRGHGVHLWQWQWDIIEKAEGGTPEKAYKAKANSHYLFSPNDPEDVDPKRPCCFPGQEYGMWHPFNCKTREGFLKGAEQASHCSDKPPDDAAKHIKKMTEQQIKDWLARLGLKGNYNSTVTRKGLTGPAMAQLCKILDKSSVANGDDDSARALVMVEETFEVGDNIGDAYIIMHALQRLL